VHEGEITICGLADRHIFFPPYFIEMGHTIPSELSENAASELLAVFIKGVRALGIRNGAAKGDVKFTSRGPMIGEIAARLSGGYMSGWTYPYASGVLPTSGALSIAVGERPDDLSPKKAWTCAERAFISIPGLVSRVEGLEAARSAEGVRDVFVRARAGDRVAFPENNVAKCGNVIASAPSRAAASRSAEEVARSILIALAPRDEATDTFLAVPPGGEGKFPPDAFALGQSLLDALADLNEGGEGPAEPARLAILPFREFENSDSRDLVGRTVTETLAAIRTLTGLPLPYATSSTPGPCVLGRGFWTALVRGGYQGAVYRIESDVRNR